MDEKSLKLKRENGRSINVYVDYIPVLNDLDGVSIEESWTIAISQKVHGENTGCIAAIDIDDAKKIRDFLIYALDGA